MITVANRIYVTPEYADAFEERFRTRAGLVDGMRDMAIVARKAPEAEFFTMPPEMLFVNRLQFGFYSVLARLDVEVDYAAVERAFLQESGIRD